MNILENAEDKQYVSSTNICVNRFVHKCFMLYLPIRYTKRAPSQSPMRDETSENWKRKKKMGKIVCSNRFTAVSKLVEAGTLIPCAIGQPVQINAAHTHSPTSRIQQQTPSCGLCACVFKVFFIYFTLFSWIENLWRLRFIQWKMKIRCALLSWHCMA